MPANPAELDQLKTRVNVMREVFLQRIREQRETGTVMVGDVNPDNIVKKADEYEQMLERPGVTEEDLKRWMDEHTSGTIEKGLIFVTISHRGTQRSLGKVNEILTADLPDDSLRQEFTELQNHYLGLLAQYDQVTNYLHTIASGIPARQQELGELEKAVQDLTVD